MPVILWAKYDKEILRLHADGLNPIEIAARTGFCNNSVRSRLIANGVTLIRSKYAPKGPRTPAGSPVAPKSSPASKTPTIEPKSDQGFSVIAEARAVLIQAGRLRERKDITFLDGKVATIPDILRAANRVRQERGEKLHGKNPERWM
jgi:hypothetical protein